MPQRKSAFQLSGPCSIGLRPQPTQGASVDRRDSERRWTGALCKRFGRRVKGRDAAFAELRAKPSEDGEPFQRVL